MTKPAGQLPAPVRAAVLKELPEADVDHATLLGSGIATHAYQIADPSGAWVVRVSVDYPEPWRWRGGRAYEVPLLRALAGRGLPVPGDPFSVQAEDGLPIAIVERKISGERLVPPVCDGEQDRLAGQLADFLIALHSFPGSEAAAIGVPRSPVALEARHHLELASPFLSSRVRRWVDREISDLEGAMPPSSVVHRDIRAEHLYVDAAGDLVGVIDFGDSTIDDPALDFAKIAGDFGDHFLQQTLRQYGGSPVEDILVRVQTYRHLETLWEVAEDAWGARAKAIQRLSALADATRSKSEQPD